MWWLSMGIFTLVVAYLWLEDTSEFWTDLARREEKEDNDGLA